MSDQLRPLTLGEVLDRTAQLYRSRFLVYVGIAVIPAATWILFLGAAVVVLGWIGVVAPRNASPAQTSVVAMIVMMIIGTVAVPACLGSTALGWAAMNHAAAQALFGEPISIRAAYRDAWARKWQYLWLGILLVLIVAVAPMTVFLLITVVSAGLASLARSSGLGTLSILLGGFVLLLGIAAGVYCIWMLLRLCLAFPASVVERARAWEAVRRGAVLSYGTKGRIVVLFLLGTALCWLLAMAIMVPAMIALALIPGLGRPQHNQALGLVLIFLYYGSVFLVQALTKPVYGIALTLFYFDQRIRTEGFDIEWIMRKAGMVAVPAPQPAPAALSGPVLPEVAITTKPGESVAIAPQLHPGMPKSGDVA
jgi:hypothetical protein